MVKYFPFDTQNCSLDFSSWTFDAHTINLLIQGGRVGDTTNYMNNSEWDLIEYLQERKVRYHKLLQPSTRISSFRYEIVIEIS